MRIVHVLQALARGGAARATVNAARESARSGEFEHRIVSLTASDRFALEWANAAGIAVHDRPAPGELHRILGEADIVQVNFWNSPEIYSFLHSELPAMRLLLWVRVAGDTPPQVLTADLIDFSDYVLAGCPHTARLPVVQEVAETGKPTGMVWPGADFGRLREFEPRKHEGYNVGYIGAVDFAKIHPAYAAMSSRASVPGIRFVVCGIGDAVAPFQRQVQDAGIADRFDWRGYVEEIGPVLQTLDVFGYPLCEGTSASAEVVLQEAMFAGVPPVIFARGGMGDVIEHGRTGLIVHTEREYVDAIEYLFERPAERRRLSENARAEAREVFGVVNTARRLNAVYRELVELPRRRRRWPGAGPDCGASTFVESLGSYGAAFETSRTSSEIDALLEAELAIRHSPPVLMTPGGGGILHYRGCHREDKYLRLWSGLVLLEQGRPALATAEFSAARRLGLDHWRLDWYLAQAAERAGLLDVARQLIAPLADRAAVSSSLAAMAERLGISQENAVPPPNGSRQ